MNEDLRDWFGKGGKGGVGGRGWDRYNTKGERIGKCAREPGEPKPKCLSKEKAAKMSKDEIAAAVRRKRKADPVADRKGKGGKPKMVSNKIGEQSQPDYGKFDRRVNAARATKNKDLKIKLLKSAIPLRPENIKDEYGGEKRFCPLCGKEETRSECSYGPKMWDKFSIATVHPANEELTTMNYTEDDLFIDLSNLCFENGFFDTEEETYYFAESLIQSDLVFTFLEDLAEELNINISDYLAEGLKSVISGVGKGYQAARGIINALSKSSRAKAGVKAGTALGKKPESAVKGAAASQSIRSARKAQRAATKGPKPDVANRYLQALQSKRAARGLPPAGGTSAGTPKAIRSRAQVKAKKSELSQKGKDAQQWQRYQGSARKEVERTRQAPKPEWDRPKLPAAKQTSKKSGSGLTHTVRATGDVGPYKGLEKYKPTSTTPTKKPKGAGATAAAGTAAAASKTKDQKPSTKSSASSSVGKYNTMDPSGKVRSRLKVGEKKVGEKKVGTQAQNFDKSFAAARKAGESEFDWKGKKYTTKLKEDHKEVASGKKVDDEGYMARTELDKIEKAVGELRGVIKSPKMQLPAWVQSKITKAVDYLDTAADYLQTDEVSEEKDPCWKGYKQVGMKKKGSKMVPNCVPEELEERFERINTTGKTYRVFFIFRGKYDSIQFFFPTSKRPSKEEVVIQLRKIYPEANLVNYIERDREPNAPLIQVEGATSFNKFLENVQSGPLLPGEGRKVYPKDKAPKPTGAKLPLASRGKGGSPYEPYTGPEKKGPYVPAPQRPKPQMASYEPEGELVDENLIDTVKNFVGLAKDRDRKVSEKTPMGKAVTGLQKRRQETDKYLKMLKNDYQMEDWQKVNRKDKTDGLSQKAVNAYRRENPGSKLQTAVTEKNPEGKRAERRKSFCRRMSGMKSKLTSSKTARDPDSRINKALRRWNCN